jgi:hypothetical protein
MIITDWAPECRRTCFPFPCESPVVALQPNIPEVYQDLREVFPKTRITCLHPHHHWKCAIDLLAGSEPPRSSVQLSSLDIQVSPALFNPSLESIGGPPWSRMSLATPTIVSYVPKLNLSGTLQQGNSFPFQCLSVPGLICPLILSLISPPLMVSTLFWWL